MKLQEPSSTSEAGKYHRSTKSSKTSAFWSPVRIGYCFVLNAKELHIELPGWRMSEAYYILLEVEMCQEMPRESSKQHRPKCRGRHVMIQAGTALVRAHHITPPRPVSTPRVPSPIPIKSISIKMCCPARFQFDTYISITYKYRNLLLSRHIPRCSPSTSVALRVCFSILFASHVLSPS